MSSYLCCLSLLLQPTADVFVKILAGDEVIQVNDQIVVSVTICIYSMCTQACMYSICVHIQYIHCKREVLAVLSFMSV